MLVIAIVGFVPASHSHELRPAVLDITLGGAEEAQVTAELNFIAEGFLAEIDLSLLPTQMKAKMLPDMIRYARSLQTRWPDYCARNGQN